MEMWEMLWMDQKDYLPFSITLIQKLKHIDN
jgi:hypothetical protein